MPKAVFAPTRRRRSLAGPILILILLAIVGLLVWAYMKDTEVAPATIEQDVTNALGR